jgi:hypothetical protein
MVRRQSKATRISSKWNKGRVSKLSFICQIQLPNGCTVCLWQSRNNNAIQCINLGDTKSLFRSALFSVDVYEYNPEHNNINMAIHITVNCHVKMGLLFQLHNADEIKSSAIQQNRLAYRCVSVLTPMIYTVSYSIPASSFEEPESALQTTRNITDGGMTDCLYRWTRTIDMTLIVSLHHTRTDS